MSLRVSSSAGGQFRYAFVITLLLLSSSAIAQCNLNGNWAGTYSGTEVLNGVNTPDHGTVSLTIFNATATTFNVTLTTINAAGEGDSNSFVGTLSGNSLTFSHFDATGGGTVNATVASNCTSMTGTYNVNDVNDISNGSFSLTKNSATLSISEVTFQSAVVGKSTGTQSLTLTNSGSSGLSLGPPTTTGDFSATTTCSANLPPGTGCSIGVTCNPTGPGIRTGTLFINDQNKSPIGSAPLTCSGVAPLAGAGFFPQSGWWWDSSLNGTGFFIEYGGNSGQGLFVGGFLYDSAGNSTWLVSTGPLTSAKYTSTWIKTAAGQTLTGPYKAPSQTVVANITLSFTDATHAVLTRPDGTLINLTRFTFSALPPNPPTKPVGGAPQSGWWWAGDAFSGTGYGIEIQGSNVFVVAYVYDNNGAPVWYLATGALTSPNNYSGQWDLYAGGPQLTAPEGTYTAHTVAGASVPMTLSFADGANGTLTMGSVVIPITRFQTY